MGTPNQLHFLKGLFTHPPTGPILEVGSKDHGNTQPFRHLYPDNGYMGVDLEAGPNVDKVVDLTEGIGGLPEHRYELIICCSILEHVKQPFTAAENITRLLAPGGTVFVSTPWVWRFHPYPNDYWRFTPSGIEEIFSDLTFDGRFWYSGYLEHDITMIGDTPFGVDDNMAIMQDGVKYLPYLDLFSVGVKE